MDKNVFYYKWDDMPKYGEYLYKRAIGELGEMESSINVCFVIKELYKPGKSILDVGCGSGHYYRSLKRHLDINVNYKGVDKTRYYIELARKAFNDNKIFAIGDVYNLEYEDSSFDIVMCNNLIIHLPPPPTLAIKELIRVSNQAVIIRVYVGERNYIIKEVLRSDQIEGVTPESDSPESEADLIKPNGELVRYGYLNMYTKRYYAEIIKRIDSDVKIEFISDNLYEGFDNRCTGGKSGLHVVDGKQISGNLLKDFQFILITKRDV